MSESPALDPAVRRTRWQAFAIAVAVASLTILDLSKVNVALPTIEVGLGATSVDLQLIVAGYALAFGLLLVPSGRLGDIGSRKRLFIIGLVVFGLASLLCGAAMNPTVLVIARIIQGAAAGILMPQVMGVIQQLFQGKERGAAFGAFGAIIGLATAFGPTIGGLLVGLGGADLGWRLSFWMNVPLVLLLLPFAIKLLPSTQQHSGAKSMDPIGIVLLGIAIFSLMLPFVLTSGSDDDDPRRWLLLIVFAAAVVGFIFWERAYRGRGLEPVLDFALLRHRSFRYGLLLASVYFAGMPATFLIVTLYLQQGLGLEAVFSGMVTIPFAIASAITAWYSGRWVNTLGRRIVVVGLVLVIIGFAAALLAAILLPAELAPWGMSAALLIAGAGGGGVISPNQTLMLSEVPVTQGGVAGSFAQVGQRAGTAIGVAAVSSTFYATIFREQGELAELVVYHDAIRNGLLIAIGFIAVALVFALLDRPRKGEFAEQQA